MAWTGEPPIMPFKLPSAAERLARSIAYLIETAKRDAERMSPVEAAGRERQLFEDVPRACDEAMKWQQETIDKLYELLVERENTTLRPIIVPLYPLPLPGGSATVIHVPTEKCDAKGVHALERCEEYGKQPAGPEPSKIPEGPPERWPKIPKEWL